MSNIFYLAIIALIFGFIGCIPFFVGLYNFFVLKPCLIITINGSTRKSKKVRAGEVSDCSILIKNVGRNLLNEGVYIAFPPNFSIDVHPQLKTHQLLGGCGIIDWATPDLKDNLHTIVFHFHERGTDKYSLPSGSTQKYLLRFRAPDKVGTYTLLLTIDVKFLPQELKILSLFPRREIIRYRDTLTINVERAYASASAVC